jgi:DNA (cytosine-5)-methyltransferase 1
MSYSIDVPLTTITSKAEHCLIDFISLPGNKFDIQLRMLQPHELFSAQGFPSDYIFDKDSIGKKFTKEIQVAKCGNSVCPGIAEILVRENITKLK